jgi:hypothetical protein
VPKGENLLTKEDLRDHEQLSIATNTRIYPGPRVGVFTNVVGYSHPVASAKLARRADTPTTGDTRRSQSCQQLFDDVNL